jgi:hypothetical protein
MYNMSMANIVEDHPSVVSKKYILNANDRCDKCEAQALVRVKGLSGQLTFCNHHYEKIMNNPDSYNKMMAFLVEILDERDKLIKDKTVGGI